MPTPILAHELLILTSAHGRLRPMRAVRPEATGNITFRTRDDQCGHPPGSIRARNHMQTPDLRRGLDLGMRRHRGAHLL